MASSFSSFVSAKGCGRTPHFNVQAEQFQMPEPGLQRSTLNEDASKMNRQATVLGQMERVAYFDAP